MPGHPMRLSRSESWVRPVSAAMNAVVGSRGCLLTFHRAAPAALWERLPNRNFYANLDFLDRLLSYLAQTGWAIVTVEEALARSRRGEAGDRYVNFSIDDCYRDTFEEVVPLFRQHGVPITLYVTTGIPDMTLPLWGAGLEAVLLERDVVRVGGEAVGCASPQEKQALFARVARAWDGPQSAAAYSEFCAANGVDAEALHWKHAISWEMLAALRDDPLVEIGGHTVSHPRVASLDAEAAAKELTNCRARLKEKVGVDARHFAFPYGRSGDCGPRDFALAREAGFVSAATTCKGLLRQGQDPFRLPRNTLNGAHRHVALVEMHLAGFTGLAARALGRV